MIYSEDLDLIIAGGCSNPDCKEKHGDTLDLAQGCHPGAGVAVSYTKGTGLLQISCMACRRPVAKDIAVTSKVAQVRS